MFKALLPLFLFTGCSKVYVEQKHTHITIDEKFPWLEEPTNVAEDFWMEHGILYGSNLGPIDKALLAISAEDMDGTRVGYCDGVNTLNKSKIMIEKSLIDNPTIYTSCIIAHELGHYIGMHHVKQGISLMAPVQSLTKDNVCAWSDDDRKELDRVNHQE